MYGIWDSLENGNGIFYLNLVLPHSSPPPPNPSPQHFLFPNPLVIHFIFDVVLHLVAAFVAIRCYCWLLQLVFSRRWVYFDDERIVCTSLCECTATGWQLWCTHVLYYILYICVRVRSMEIRFIRVRSSHYVRHIDYYIIEYRVMATIAWCGLYGVGELNCQIHASSNGHSLEIERWTWQRQQQRAIANDNFGWKYAKQSNDNRRRVKETMRNETSVFC